MRLSMTEHFPRQFGKYVLLKSLARGGMGEIHLAASAGAASPTTKLCVIKKVIKEKTEPAKVNRFLDEAKVVLRLSHSNLVSTFDAGDVDGELFIAMELVEGKDLRAIWNRCVRTRTRIPVDVALVVVQEIARALAYVHTYGGLGLVHRDVAPPNILLSYRGDVKLTDFGLARSILKQEHTAPGVVFGRASYLAPEQARGEVADARTDVYSLGIVLWELLTGQSYLQLAGLDPVTSLSLVRHPKTQPPSSRAPWIVPELDAVVLKALTADRAERFQSAEDMRLALSEVTARVAPRADGERIAQFLRGLYRDTLGEETAERERLLVQVGSFFDQQPEPRRTAGKPARARRAPVAQDDLDPFFAPSPGPRSGRFSAASGDVTDVASSPPETATSRVVPAPDESLAASALRVRASSHVRRVSADLSGAELTTKVWRRGRGPRGEDAAQTFVGRVIDSRYFIKHRIGEGGMGTVYAAEHVDIGKTVAVKILHRLFSGEEQLVERFRREARAASRVGHPHIIEVTDFGTTEEGCAYFVMEYLEGMDLADVLVREGRVHPARAVRIAIQICQALEAAHTAGVIHRDLKPENIFLVTRDAQVDFVKVLDFGIARDLFRDSGQLTNPGMTMGTPEYMAPEQSLGRPADRRTDVYAVGALLYEMVTGTAPFKADSHREMLESKRRPPESLRKHASKIPPALDEIILRALGPDPDRRPQTMAELEQDLAGIVWDAQPAAVNVQGARRFSTPRQQAKLEIDERPSKHNGDSDEGGERIGASEHADGVDQGVKQRQNATTPHDKHASEGAASTPDGDGGDARGRISHDQSEGATTMDLPPRGRRDSARPASLAGPLARMPAVGLEPEAHVQAETSTLPPVTRVGTPSPAGFSPVRRARDSSSGTGWSTRSTADQSAADAAAVSRAFAPGSGELEDAGDVADVGELGLDGRPAPAPRVPGTRRMAIVAGLIVLGGGSLAWMITQGPPPVIRDWGRVFGVRSAPRLSARGAGPAASPGNEGAKGAKGADSANGTVVKAVTPTPGGPEIVALAPRPPTGGPHIQGDSGPGSARRPFDIVQTPPPVDRARTALAAGLPDDAIAVLRPAIKGEDGAVRPLLADALVASGWRDAKAYRWSVAIRKAREALALTQRSGSSHGAHALLGESLYAVGSFGPALSEFLKALAETPGDARLRRRVIRSRRQLHRPSDDNAAAQSTGSEPPAEPASEE
jgi:serine/threonine protein kinase